MPASPTLRDPSERVSVRAPWLWAAGALAFVAVVAVAGVVADLVWLDVPWWAWPTYAVVAIGYVVAMPVYRYQVHRWESTETAVYTQRGWLARERRIAPMSRVQTVDLEQGPVARLAGLAQVTVTTASAAGPLRIEGLDLPVAQRLVDDLTRRTAAEPGDAT